MDTCIGLVGKDYVLLASDATAARGIMVFKTDEDKILSINPTKALAMTGPQGDRAHFGEFVQKNMHLYELRHSIKISTHAVANFARNELSTAIRKGPYEVNCLLGGVDDNVPSLYLLDYLGTLAKVNFGIHGHVSNFCLSVLDRYWKEDMSLEEGKQVMKYCLHEIRQRFIVSMPEWKFKLITKDGTAEIELYDKDELKSLGSSSSSSSSSSDNKNNTSSSSGSVGNVPAVSPTGAKSPDTMTD